MMIEAGTPVRVALARSNTSGWCKKPADDERKPGPFFFLWVLVRDEVAASNNDSGTLVFDAHGRKIRFGADTSVRVMIECRMV